MDRASFRLRLEGLIAGLECNTSQLRYIILLEQALVFNTSGQITPHDLAGATSGVIANGSHDEFLAALHRHNGDRTRTAAALGINRVTLWRRLRALDHTASVPATAQSAKEDPSCTVV